MKAHFLHSMDALAQFPIAVVVAVASVAAFVATLSEVSKPITKSFVAAAVAVIVVVAAAEEQS